MKNGLNITPMLAELDSLCRSGYAIALHIKFTTPTFLFQSYRKEWIDYYSQNGLVLHDPTVRWGFENNGTKLWSDLADDDSEGIFEKAAEYDINFGFVHAMEGQGSRSVASFSRDDREFSEAEQEEIIDILGKLHEVTANNDQLPVDEVAALKQLSITLTHG